MEPLIALLILFFLAVTGYLVMFRTKRSQRTRQVTEEAESKTEEQELLTPTLEPQSKVEPKEREETKPTTVEEAQPQGAEELQATVAEESQPTVVNEAKPTAPDETGPSGEKEAQTQVPEKVRHTYAEEVPVHEDRGGQKPKDRGGRPRVPAQGNEVGSVQETKRRHPKPEIICWNRERQWILGIDMPDELLENAGLVVLQNGSALLQDDYMEGRWYLNNAAGEIIVRWIEHEGIRETKLVIKENYFLFKLSGQDYGQGRLVRSPSSGLYLMIVPDDWVRDDDLSGPPPVQPEPVSLTGYKGHFFDLERDSDTKIAFLTPEGKSGVIDRKAPRFELVGNKLDDASEHIGILFGERPPTIRSPGNRRWKDVETIIVGEEGSGRGRWRMHFMPERKEIETNLPSEILARKAGWYFLRFYNTNNELIDSLDFRFISALSEIRVHQPPPLPNSNGHQAVCVEFLHKPCCAVQPIDGAGSIQIESQDDKTIVTIPPDPTYDKTHWLVSLDNGTSVEATILVERVWWAENEEEKEPSGWVDRPFTLSREAFNASSRKAIWLRLPKHRWVDKVLVGFEQSNARPYAMKLTEKTVPIPLREFGDALEGHGIGLINLKLWICFRGKTYEQNICELSIKLRCRFCDFINSNEEDMMSHVCSSHMNDIFRHLTYEELRALIPSLPYKIYRCSYCDFYFESGDLRNPTGTICDHIQLNCPKVPRGIGPVRIQFRIISDPDEVRENVIHNLQRIYKCQLCNHDLNDPDESDMREHVESHRNKLYHFY